MVDSTPTPASAVPVRWGYYLLLLLVLAGGTGIRIHRLSGRSLWMDEYWSVYLSTARGQPQGAVFDAPRNVVIDPPPATGFSGAPPWWRVWTGMSSAVHPPLYHIVLRWWIDCFGDSDLSVRSLSAVLGLASALLLFEIVFRSAGPWPALLATALMLFSIAQIDLSTEARSYALLVFLGLVCCRSVLMIQRSGASPSRLAILGLAAAAMALTHYFAAGFLLGLGAYTIICLRGKNRLGSFAALAIAGVLVLATWGPFFWTARHLLGEQGDYPLPGTTLQIFGRLLALPSRMILSPTRLTWLDTYPLAMLVFLVPLLWMRRTSASLWWLWLAGGVGCVVFFDLIRQTLMISVYKFLLPAGPAMYALVAAPTPDDRGKRWRAPLMIFLCVGALISIFETWVNLNSSLWAGRAPLIFIMLVPLAVAIIIAARKQSWPVWAIIAGAITAIFNLALLASANLSPTAAILLIVFAYLLLAITAPAKKDCRWLTPLFGTLLALGSIAITWQWIESGAVIIPMPDWKTASRLIDQQSAPDQTLAFTACRESNPIFCYIVFNHYSPNSHHPVIFLDEKGPSAATRSGLARQQCVWMIGLDPQADSQTYFPGWSIGKVISVPGNCNIWPVFPPGVKALDQ